MTDDRGAFEDAWKKAMEEVERLQRHIDLAFEDVIARDCAAARKHLTDARWGVGAP